MSEIALTMVPPGETVRVKVFTAIAYVFNRAVKAFTVVDKEPKCEDCTLGK